jgi:two-component system chemotaxis response regulator CheY
MELQNNYLVVEDDPTTNSIFSKWLSAEGQCSSFENGEDALKLFEEKIKAKEYFQLLILDINLPGMNGFEILKKVRDLEELHFAPSSKVLMATANEDTQSLMTAFEAQCDGYLRKPFSKSMFKKEIAKAGHALPSETLET